MYEIEIFVKFYAKHLISTVSDDCNLHDYDMAFCTYLLDWFFLMLSTRYNENNNNYYLKNSTKFIGSNAAFVLFSTL